MTSQISALPVTVTLKNLYRLIVNADYPEPAARVIPLSNKKGLTLVRFWQTILLPDVIVDEKSERLWRTTDARNRYLSDLTNRTGTRNFYAEYFDALEVRLSPRLIGNVLARTRDFLLQNAFSYPVLKEKLGLFLTCVKRDDPLIRAELPAYFDGIMCEMPRYEAFGREGEAFIGAYLLTMLALHALLGARMNDTAMRALRGDGKARPEALYAAENPDPRLAPRVITRQNSELCRTPLPQSAFFGRESELKALQALVGAGGKLIVNGMGGIGKTEIVRQLLSELSAQGIFARVAFVQYEESLAASFRRAFEHLCADTAAGWLNESRAILEDAAQGRTLLLIDNVDKLPENDPALNDLSGYACDILVTSRFEGVPYFASYPLQPLPLSKARELFLYAYGRAIPADELPALDGLLKEKALGHPLTIRILAQLASVRRWNIDTLIARIEQEGLKLSFTRKSVKTRLPDIYRRMFSMSALTAGQTDLLRLMALLPYRTYAADWLYLYARDISDERETLDELLSQLRALGWLDENFSGFAMHPVIAEAMLLTPPEFETFPRFFDALRGALDKDLMLEQVDDTALDVAMHALFLLPNLPEEGLTLLRAIFIALMQDFQYNLAADVLKRYAPCYARLSAPTPYARFLFAGSLCYEERLRVDILPPDTLESMILDSDSDSFPTFERCRVLFDLMNCQLIARRPINPLLEKKMGELAKSGNIYLAMVYSYLAIYLTVVAGDTQKAAEMLEKGFTVLHAHAAEDSLYAFELHVAGAGLNSTVYRPERAIVHIDSARAIALQWFPDGSSERLPRIYECEHRLYDRLGQYDKAIEVVKKQIEIFDRNAQPEFEYVQLYANMGYYLSCQKRYDEAIRWIKRALNALGEGTDEQHRCGKLRCYTLLGNAHMGKGDRTARDYLLLAVRVGKTFGEQSINYAEPLYSLAKFYLTNGETQQGAEALRAVLPVFAACYGEESERYREAKALLP